MLRIIDIGEKSHDEKEIFYLQKGQEKKKNQKREVILYVNHRKRVMLIGYSKEREEEFRQYWDNEIRDQRKWTRGMNLF